MEKPKPQKIERLDYHDCSKYIEHKLGYDLRDTLGKFSGKKDWESIEYRDFWHFLIDTQEVHNGCDIYMPYPDETEEEWQKEILQAFHNEFGEGPYWVWW